MNHGDLLPDPNLDDFDPVGDLDYGDEDPEVPGPSDPRQPSSNHGRINSSDSLPGMIDGDRGNSPLNIGPSLPPGFILGGVDDGTPDDPGSDEPSLNVGPALPAGISLGPSLPDDDGPPPEPSTSRSIGPALPPHIMNMNNEEEEEEDINDLYGPAMPVETEEESVDEDNEMIGPLPPPVSEEENDKAAEEYALRRLAYEQEKEREKNNSKREEWMLHLPKKLTNYGLGARTFGKGGGVEKDSSWTDAPGQKKRKIAENDQPGPSGIVMAAQKARDEEQEKIAEQLSNSKKESLLDAHQKTRCQSATNGTLAAGVRKPFDREKDMEVRGLKNASASEIKQKVGNLGSRFAGSSKQKFL